MSCIRNLPWPTRSK